MSNLSFRELTAYKKSFSLAMEIFHLTVSFPAEEKYGLSSQIKRSSRSVCATIAEGYRKRIYRAHFISKSSDADMENSETQVWLDFALHCKFIDPEIYRKLCDKSEEVGRLINHMIENPEKYLRKNEKHK